MFYIYETDAGTFVLERQAFTESAWQFVFNGRFIDSFACPFEAAHRISRDGALLGVIDRLLLPPPSLSGWEVHWSKAHGGDAPELWLHRMYMEGKPRIGPAGP